MAIEILESITLPSGTYTFYCPDWLKTYLLQYPTSSHSWGNEAVTGSYEMYSNQYNTFPFSYQYATPSGIYTPSSPANITLQTGITDNYFNWPISAASSVATTMSIFINGNSVGGIGGGGNSYNRWSWYFGIDESTQKGYCWRVLNFGTYSSVPNEYNTGLEIGGYGGGTYELYCFLKDIMTPSITWSPVSSITGKLGTLRLSQIVNINDGEPVSGATGSTKRVTPVVIPSEYKEYIDNINHMYIWIYDPQTGGTHGTEFFDAFDTYGNNQIYIWENNVQHTINFNPYEWTYVGYRYIQHYDSTTYSDMHQDIYTIPSKVRIDISTNQDSSVNVAYSAYLPTTISSEVSPGYQIEFRNDTYYTNKVVGYALNRTGYYDTSYFETMSGAINYIFTHYCNVDIYVDNVCWTSTVPDIFLTDESLVSAIISKVVMDETKVGVEYNVPSGSYDYVKLVYKQDEEPIDVNDGTAIDIEVGDGIVGIDGIADGNTYWFKIFTDSTASEAFEFTTTLIVQTIKIYDANDIVYLKRNSSGDPVAKKISDISAYGIEQGYGGSFALLDAGNSRNGLLVRFINISGDTIYFADEEWLGQQYNIGYNAEEGSYTVNRTLYGAMSNGTITAFSVSATGSTKTIDEMQFIYFGDNTSGNAALQGFYVTDNFTHVYVKTPINPVHKGRYTTNPDEIIKVYTYSYSTPTYTNLTCAQILQAIKDTDPSYNQNAVGFMTIPGNLEDGTYEVQALDFASGDDIYITNYFPGYTDVKGNTSYVYIYVTNSTASGARSRQYMNPVYSNNKYTFSGYRNAYFSSKTYEGNQYRGKGKDTDPTYTGVTLYFDPHYFGNIYYNGTKVN